MKLNDWNPYPKIKPPIGLIVFVEYKDTEADSSKEKYRYIAEYYGINEWSGLDDSIYVSRWKCLPLDAYKELISNEGFKDAFFAQSYIAGVLGDYKLSAANELVRNKKSFEKNFAEALKQKNNSDTFMRLLIAGEMIEEYHHQK